MSSEKVTLRDIYDAVGSLEDKIEKRITKLEDRVLNLESFQGRVLGILSIATIFISAAATFIWNKILGRS